jgi:hypothetical protein
MEADWAQRAAMSAISPNMTLIVSCRKLASASSTTASISASSSRGGLLSAPEAIASELGRLVLVAQHIFGSGWSFVWLSLVLEFV